MEIWCKVPMSHSEKKQDTNVLQHSLSWEHWNIKKYMTVGRPLKISFIWDVVGLSSSIRLKVMWEQTKLLGSKQRKCASVRTHYLDHHPNEKKLNQLDKIWIKIIWKHQQKRQQNCNIIGSFSSVYMCAKPSQCPVKITQFSPITGYIFLAVIY